MPNDLPTPTALSKVRDLLALARAAGRTVPTDVEAWLADPRAHREAISRCHDDAVEAAENYGGGPCVYVTTALWVVAFDVDAARALATVERQIARFGAEVRS